MSRIGIIGAGIGGLTTALTLAQRGIKTQIFEQAAQLSAIGAGIQISPNAGHILKSLQLTQALEESAAKPDFIHLYDGVKNQQLTELPIQNYCQHNFHIPYYVMHRAQLQKMLLEAILKHQKTALHLDRRYLASLASDDYASLTFEDQSGETHITDCDLVIGADGIHSAIRGEVRAGLQKKSTGLTAWRCLLSREQMRSLSFDAQQTHLWMGADFHLVGYPLHAQSFFNVVLILKSSDSNDETMLPSTELYKKCASLLPSMPLIIEHLLDINLEWHPWPLYTVSADEPWYHGPFILMGDSAHAMVPFAAQGGAMAIEDGYCLGQLIADNINDLSRVCYLFQQMRQKRVQKVWQTSMRNKRLYHASGLMSEARNIALKTIHPQLLLRRYSWLYGWRYKR